MVGIPCNKANYKPRGNIMTQDELDVFVNELLEGEDDDSNRESG